MHLPTDIPELAIVRALTNGGPYAEGDAISVAFTEPKIGRLLAHDPSPSEAISGEGGSLLPETISAVVVRAAGPYGAGDVVTLSFVDPAVARIHPASTTNIATARTAGASADAPLPAAATTPAKNRRALDGVAPVADVAAVEPVELVVQTTAIASSALLLEGPDPSPAGDDPEGSDAFERFGIHSALSRLPVAVAEVRQAPAEPKAPARPALRADATGVRLRLSWSDDRTRRFVQVTDKLFTVDRLGWYRHAFAMRLLVPDEITCGDPPADAEASRYLRALRSAALETLGRPLIAAFMPTFTVTPEWLDTIDSTEAARALYGLRTAIAPFATNDDLPAATIAPSETHGVVLERNLLAAPQTSIEAMLPLLIANVSEFADVTERLTSYRQALIELFGGTAASAETVRLGQMAQPNHTLDDRLWQLVGAVSERFGGLAVV